jgi:hypothetical protein
VTHRNRHPNPHRAVTGRPEVLGCSVNSVDEHGVASVAVARIGHGQLVTIHNGVVAALDEKRFHMTLMFWHENPRGK